MNGSERSIASLMPSRRSLLIGVLGWTLFAFLEAQIISSQEPMAPFWSVMMSSLVSSSLYAMLGIGVWLWTTHVLMPRHWAVQIAGHVVGAPLYAWSWYMLYRLVFLLVWGEELFELTKMEQYKTWMMNSAGMIYCVLAGIFHVTRYREKVRQKELAESELLLRTSRIELAVLKSQLNPHFLFNTLNTVNALIGSEPESARSVIARLATILRYSLDSDRQPLVPLGDELRFIETYLEIEKERFGSRIRTEIAIGDAERALMVPPMILQPLVENSIRHGVAPKESGGTVRVGATRIGDELHVEVIDDGAGIEGRDPALLLHGGHGLFNTDQRLRKMFGERHGLEIEGGAWGVRVRFHIPAIEPREIDHSLLIPDHVESAAG